MVFFSIMLSDTCVRCDISSSFHIRQVEPNPGEENDANFPRNVHNAAELFLRLGIKDNAERLHSAVTKLFQLLEQGPDGRTTHTLGRACICWSCGHAGIPANADSCSEKGTSPAGVCNKCGDSSQTNFLKVTQPDGTVIPWLEFKAHAPAGAPGSKKVQPNAPCPCASGKKAKKCCFSGGGAK